MVVACVGGGSNAIGSFANYIDDPSIQLVGVPKQLVRALKLN